MTENKLSKLESKDAELKNVSDDLDLNSIHQKFAPQEQPIQYVFWSSLVVKTNVKSEVSYSHKNAYANEPC